MKRKDDLLRLAFGELADDAARAVEARAEDADRVQIEAFRRLHDDLRHLPTPPPDNLTAERLRVAILDRELKARRPSVWSPVLLAPVALAALAAAVLLPRLRPHPEPQIVSFDTSRLEARPSLGMPKLDAFSELKNADGLVPLRARSALTPDSESKPEATVVSHRRARRHTIAEPPDEPQMKTDGMVAYNGAGRSGETEEAPSVVPVATTPLPVHEPQTIAAPPSAVVEAAPGAPGKTETVVIVSSKRDLETGAPAATEKEATSVLVGG